MALVRLVTSICVKSTVSWFFMAACTACMDNVRLSWTTFWIFLLDAFVAALLWGLASSLNCIGRLSLLLAVSAFLRRRRSCFVTAPSVLHCMMDSTRSATMTSFSFPKIASSASTTENTSTPIAFKSWHIEERCSKSSNSFLEILASSSALGRPTSVFMWLLMYSIVSRCFSVSDTTLRTMQTIPSITAIRTTEMSVKQKRRASKPLKPCACKSFANSA
mmetsp:Transcript_86976/g.150097  ORF Transcript_86976/g.150097 Transcript_86976/m.150097 type:complete len:219 (+) Transcript_86976:237-893(+)